MQLDPMIVVLALLVGLLALFVLTHLRPLSESEVEQLASKRRQKVIRQYFAFDRREYIADRLFKKRMRPNGKYYQFNERLYTFPATAASLLKYKKHEWIIIAFERNQVVCVVWMNKGVDRSGVSPYIDEKDVVRRARQDGYSSVLILHNHPNPDPSALDCTSASQQDLASAVVWANALGREGVNLVEFVCERGSHYEYYRSIATAFKPLTSFVSIVQRDNGRSRWRNLFLHLERLL